MVGVATTEYYRDLEGTDIGKIEVAKKASSPIHDEEKVDEV